MPFMTDLDRENAKQRELCWYNNGFLMLLEEANMNNRSLVAVLAAFLMMTGSSFASPSEDDETVRAAITHTALDYVEGWYTGDAARLARALHPDLNKVRVVQLKNGSEILQAQTADLLVKASERPIDEPEERPTIEVEILSISKNTASVKIVSPDFVDLAHVARRDGDWVIVNVLWHVTDSAN